MIFFAGVLVTGYFILEYPYDLKLKITSFFFAPKKALETEGKDNVVIKTFPFNTDSSLAEWDEKTFSNRSTEYSLANYKDKECVKAVSLDSASALYYRDRISLEDNTYVSWYWAPGEFPQHRTRQDLMDKDEYDFVAQVYVIFHANFYLNAKAIMYVWTYDLPVGTIAASPYTKNVKILVLESGPSEGWKFEKRDVKKDYLELFGEPLKKDIMAISFMTDSDSTGSKAVGYYSDITVGYTAGPGENLKGKE